MVSLMMSDRGTQLQLTAPRLAPKIAIGDSVAVNGCCLTVSAKANPQLTFDLLNETLDRTNLKQLRRDCAVNLERALAAGAPLGGHFVQGHIDCSTKVISSEQSGEDRRLGIDLPSEFAHYTHLHQRDQSDDRRSFSKERRRLDHSAHETTHQYRRRRARRPGKHRVRHPGQVRRAHAGALRAARLTR